MGCGTGYPGRHLGMDPWGWEGPEIGKEPKVLLAWLRVVFRAPCCSFLDNPERKIGAPESSDDSRRKKTVVSASAWAAPALPGWVAVEGPAGEKEPTGCADRLRPQMEGEMVLKSGPSMWSCPEGLASSLGPWGVWLAFVVLFFLEMTLFCSILMGELLLQFFSNPS